MKPGQENKCLIFSSILMMLALAWLTISTPFVFDSMKSVEKSQFFSDYSSAEEDCPPPGATEEKNPTVNSISEYLHHIHHAADITDLKTARIMGHDAEFYLSHHPSLFTPPPEA